MELSGRPSIEPHVTLSCFLACNGADLGELDRMGSSLSLLCPDDVIQLIRMVASSEVATKAQELVMGEEGRKGEEEEEVIVVKGRGD